MPMTSAGGLARSRFSASLLPERDRIAIWREVFGRTNIRLEMNTLNDEPFYCECETLSFSNIAVLRATSSAISAARTRELLSDNRHDISLVMPLKGRAHAAHAGKEAEIAEGEAVVLDTSRPGPVYFPTRSEYINICVPQAALAPLVPNLEDAAMTVIPAGSEPLRLIRGYYQLLCSEDAPSTPETARIVSAHFHDLLAAAINSTGHQSRLTDSQGIRAARLKALKADIVQHAYSADMSIDEAARRLNISPRYIRKLLASENTTFSELVLNERLTHAYRILGDLRHTDRSISDIAFSVGFGDLSYFNRTFRRRFNATPSDVRGGLYDERPPASAQLQ